MDGWLESGYSLAAERNPNPGVYHFDAADYLVDEHAAKMRDICDGCQHQGGCPDRGRADADQVCIIARRLM